MCKDRTVALVDWNWMGHHPMYFKLHLRALLELGCSVGAFCPKPEEVRLGLGELSSDARSRLSLHALEWKFAPGGCPSRLQNRASTLLSVRELTKLIRDWETGHGRTVNLVFFPSIYHMHFPIYRLAEWSFPFPWAALYIHSGVFRRALAGAPGSAIPPRVDRIFRSPRLRSMGVLDEGVKEWVESRYGRRIVWFPDLTDTLVDDRSSIGAELRRFAAGRPIIGSTGFLKRSKGVLTLAKLALDGANSDLCFAFIGEVPWDNYSPEQREVIRSLVEKRPNVFTHFERIPDEGAFNSCIQACDVLFAAYLNFADSSGLLSKAAALRKPIIVSDGFLMAQRVRQYRMGEVVAEGDADSAIRSIRKILGETEENRTCEPNWAGYLAQHSYELLKEAFWEVLSGT